MAILGERLASEMPRIGLNVAVLSLTLSFCTSVWGVEQVVVLGLFKDKAVLRIDGKQRVLGVGQVSPEGVRLVAADSRQAVLEVNGQRRAYALSEQISGQYAKPKHAEVVLWPDNQGLYAVDATINGIAVNCLVDTGANVVAMGIDQAAKLGIDVTREGQPARVQTASGVAIGYGVKLSRVQVGTIAVENVPAVVLEGDAGPSEVLLGMSFLGRLEIERDGQRLVLRQKP
jgi:aspartyl protease family protein